jgi:hypothetical protein
MPLGAAGTSQEEIVNKRKDDSTSAMLVSDRLLDFDVHACRTAQLG